MSLTIALIVSLALNFSFAHICIIEPQQRGAFAINGAGSSNCYRRTAECGGIAAGTPTATYHGGSQQNIIVQQNFNHWAQSTPGAVDIAMSLNINNPTDADFVTLASINDFPGHEQVLQTNFSFVVTVPKVTHTRPVVIRARYISRNPDESVPNNANSTFYNCADVLITAHTTADNEQPVPASPGAVDERKQLMLDIHNPSSELSRRVEHLAARARRELGAASHSTPSPTPTPAPTPAPITGCCASDQFGLRARRTLRTNNDVTVIDDMFEVDQIQQVTRNTQSPRGNPSGAFYAISDFQNSVEYFVNASTQTCANYGPDEWYPFCWGDLAAPGTQFLLKVNSTASYFANGDLTWIWAVVFVAGSQTCLPVLDFHANGTASTIREYNHWQTYVDSSRLQKPSFCK